MAAPAYTTDLTLLDDCADNTGWAEPTATGWTSLNVVQSGETDYFIEGTACNSATVKTGVGGLLYDAGASGITIPADGAFVIWTYWGAPNSLDAETNGGIRLLAGSALNAFYAWKDGGSDSYTYGGWVNRALNPAIGSPDYTLGAPSGTVRYVGWCYNAPTSVPSKGNPYAVDAVYYGRCQARFSGGDGGGYATFAGFAAVNDGQSARWGLLQVVDGGYLWKGLISLGFARNTTTYRARASGVATLTTAAAHGLEVGDVVVIAGVGGFGYNATAAVASAPTTTTFTYSNAGGDEGSTADTGGTVDGVVDFRDSNRTILVQNTKKVTAGFNKIEIRQASSRVDWTGVSIQALGTVSKGAFEVVDDADVNLDGCTFTDMSTFIFKAASTTLSSVFRRCGLVTQNGATFTSCRFENSPAAASVKATNPSVITGSTFISDGSNHAIELDTACAGNSYNLTNLAFVGYATADGSTGNEVIYNNSGGAVTLYPAGCSGTISVRNGAGSSTTIVPDSVDVKVIVQKADGTKIASANVLLKAATGGDFPCEEPVTIANSDTTATVSHNAHGLATNDKVLIYGASHQANNGVFAIAKINDNSYSYTMGSAPGSDPTGSITSTFVFIKALTNGSGEVTMSRVVTTDQPVIGWARKATASPFYKEGPISGTVDNTVDTTFTAILSPDE